MPTKNALGARTVALAANNVGALLVQISTDDVFPVRMAEPANEFDTPHPETPYGKSKRAGEVMVRDTTPNHLIIRSSWVYSIDGGQVKDALDAAVAGKTVVARTDQFASPTSISTYVDFLIKAINRKATGVLHVTSRGMASRYEFLSHVLNTCGYDANTILVPESDLVTAEQVELESLMLEMLEPNFLPGKTMLSLTQGSWPGKITKCAKRIFCTEWPLEQSRGFFLQRS